MQTKDYSMVIDNGTNIDMTKICGCSKAQTLDTCEKCFRYFFCDDVATANGILEEYEKDMR